MVRQQGWRGAGLAVLPAAAAARGIALAIVQRQVGYIPYYLCFAVYNYLGMLGLR
jgi:hypothetical protein